MTNTSIPAAATAACPEPCGLVPRAKAWPRRLLSARPVISFLNLLGLALAGILSFMLFVLPGLLSCLLLGDDAGQAATRATHNYWCLLVDISFWGLASVITCLLLDRGQIHALPDRAGS